MPVTLTPHAVNQMTARLAGTEALEGSVVGQSGGTADSSQVVPPAGEGVKTAPDSPVEGQGVTAEAPSSEATSPAAVPTSQAESEAEDPNDKIGHAVPYGRFKRVNERGNKWKQDLEAIQTERAQWTTEREALQKELETARRYRPAEPEKKSEDDWFDDFTRGDDGQKQSATDLTNHPKFQALEKKVEEAEVARYKHQILGEIAQAREKYPQVPEEFLFNVLRSNPQADVLEAAGKIDHTFAGMVESAIAKRQAAPAEPKAKAATSSSPPVPPRPRAGGSVTSEGLLPSGSPKPRTIRQGTEGLFKHLIDNEGWAP